MESDPVVESGTKEEGCEMVAAYRVERAFSYKIRVNENTRRIVTFNGTNDGFGIDISFGMPNHSEHFASDHQGTRGLRLVTFQMSEDFWCAMKHLKKFGKAYDQNRGKSWLLNKGNLKEPKGSDGASLDSFTKKTALHFEPAWLPVLLQSVEGVAKVEYLNDNEAFPAKAKDDGTFMGFFTLTDIEQNGFELDQDGWNKTDNDIGT